MALNPAKGWDGKDVRDSNMTFNFRRAGLINLLSKRFGKLKKAECEVQEALG